jgi:hypothetical protein
MPSVRQLIDIAFLQRDNEYKRDVWRRQVTILSEVTIEQNLKSTQNG